MPTRISEFGSASVTGSPVRSFVTLEGIRAFTSPVSGQVALWFVTEDEVRFFVYNDLATTTDDDGDTAITPNSVTEPATGRWLRLSADGGGGGGGTSFTSVSTDPGSGDGAVGDWVLNTTSHVLWEKTGASTWTRRAQVLPTSQPVEGNATYAYDIDGRLEQITYASGNYKEFLYNIDGQLETINYVRVVGATGTTTTTYAYNLDGTLASVTIT